MKELGKMSTVQLKEKISELRMELVKLNAQVATGTTPKSPGLLRQTKKNIARSLTLIKQKEGGKDKKG